ncbi:hypothetical protein OSB04_015736 [Centaurea solstitialis]|uniref:TIR domain-containing protein n=1 Tax=Centaurea solstitialis TaxID=347529 RepID=A0AA38WKE3_9ASTR|nr:hypothetical protein OSB04_015736 [Centaurea solstitialis]
MAASSTSFIHKSSFKYDVFLSFRGEDTRTNFVDHLYHALKRESIETYKDDKNLEKGKKISKELIEAIQDSRFHVIVFSKNYASSSWCLDELVKIMECQKMMSEQTVYPIFFDVEPTEVRKQSGEFGKAFAKHENDETAKKWKEALVEATSLSGWDLRTTADGYFLHHIHEAEFIKLVVKDISSKLPTVSTDGNLIGMRTRINGVVSSLNTFTDEFCMIGLTGMGGIGKTTLARAVFDHICNEFEGSSFVENVRESSSTLLLGLKSLQQQVLRDVLNTQDIIVNGVFDGKTMMKKHMHSRKVLLVLDDVDHIDQLKALAGEPNWFMKGSRIIITTRDKQVLVAHKVNLIHDVNLLTDEEAICLLSRCAFGTESRSPRYNKLARQVVRYAAGLPLTITILGSSLCDANEDVWTDTLEELEKIPLDGTLQKLELSYKGLDNSCKEIFLDVACMLKGWKEHEAIRVLESRGFHAIRGLSVLEKKSLITVSGDGCLDMHDHIQEMGRYIVRRLHPDEPNKHSRLWIDKEIIDILANNQGTEETKCVKFRLYSQSNINNLKMIMKGLGNMEKLRLLLVYGYRFNVDWAFDKVSQYFPNSLQYLAWPNYPFCSLPKTFQASNLVALEMYDSQIVQLWEGRERKVLDKLRFLHLSYSKLTTFDLGLTPNLEMLDLQGCYYLVELHILVKCPKLKSLNLNDTMLSTLDLRLTPNIETLNLVGCKDLVELDMPHECPQLKSLNLSCPKLRSLNLGRTPNIEILNLEKCKYLVELDMPRKCPQLKSLNLSCPQLRSLNLDDLVFPKLENLDIRGYSELKTLDLGRTPNLKSLHVKKCSNLVELCAPIGGLKNLIHLEAQGFLRFTDIEILNKGGLPELKLFVKSIDICPLHPDNNFPKFQFECSYEEDLPSSIGNIEKLISVGFSCACTDLQSFYGSICGLQHLTNLTLHGSIPEAPKDLDRLQCLEKLTLWSTNIKHLPDSILLLKHLKILRLIGCKLLEKLPEDLCRLECLEMLVLTECIVLRDIPNNICTMKCLKHFYLGYCKRVTELPEELGHLECLEELDIRGTCINHLPQSVLLLKKGLRIVGSMELLELYKSLPEITTDFGTHGYIDLYVSRPGMGLQLCRNASAVNEDGTKLTELAAVVVGWLTIFG